MSICLNMIVRNESRVIERCLRSVLPYITTWVIVDTGSTDDTPARIQSTLSHLPGALHHRPWVDFAHNRNEALALATDAADYLLLIDADETLNPTALPPLHLDGYFAICRTGVSDTRRLFLIATRIPWRWTGALHETLTTSVRLTGASLDTLIVATHTDGARTQDPDKCRKDIALLQTLPRTPRTLFHLAGAHAAHRDIATALALYRERIHLADNPDEVYESHYRIAVLQEELAYPLDRLLLAYEAAHLHRPARLEPLYGLIHLHLRHHCYLTAYLLARHALTQPPPTDYFLTQTWLREYGILYQFTHAATYLHRRAEACTAARHLLTLSLPEPLHQSLQDLLCTSASSPSK